MEPPAADGSVFEPGRTHDGPPASRLPSRTIALDGLTLAPLPDVVFSSLANLSVPRFSDRCRVVIAEEGLGGYLIQRPLPTERSSWIGSGPGQWQMRCDDESGQLVTANSVRTPFVGPAVQGELRYHGVVMHLWLSGAAPSADDAALARAAVAYAVDVIQEQRLAAQIEDGDYTGPYGPMMRASRDLVSRDRAPTRRKGPAGLHLVSSEDDTDPLS